MSNPPHPLQGFNDSVTDAANRTVSFSYDDAGRVIEQELPDLRVIGFEYDANGNLTSLTPPGRTASAARGRLVRHPVVTHS